MFLSVFLTIFKIQGLNDPSARSPNRFFNEMRLGIKWMVVSKDIVDVGETNFVGHSIVMNHRKLLARMLGLGGRVV